LSWGFFSGGVVGKTIASLFTFGDSGGYFNHE